MLDHRPLVICVTIIAASVVNSASAQYCDGPFPWSCRGYDRPPPQAVRPWQPFPPREYVPEAQPVAPAAPVRPGGFARPVDPGLLRQYAALYARVDGEPFPIPAVRLSDIDPEYLRKSVVFPDQRAARHDRRRCAQTAFFISSRVADGRSAMAWAWDVRDSAGRAWRPSKTSRNGRTGILRRR